VTPISKVFLAGVTQTLSPRWQAGLDVRWSSLSGTPAIGALPETPGTGGIMTYTLQFIGNGLTAWQDILVMAGSILRGARTDAEQANASWRFAPHETVTIEPGLRWYRQQDTAGTKLTRTTPGLKVSWRIRDRFSLEGEGDFERSRTTGPTTDESVDRFFYYLGWRWDF
jgi:hypothetical protein